MGAYCEMHRVYREAMQAAGEDGRLDLECVTYHDALSMRQRFYTYFKYLERVVGSKRASKEEVEEAREILAIRDSMSLGVWKSGKLVIQRREFLGDQIVIEQNLKARKAGVANRHDVEAALGIGEEKYDVLSQIGDDDV